jgi:hypothetical protein
MDDRDAWLEIRVTINRQRWYPVDLRPPMELNKQVVAISKRFIVGLALWNKALHML